jgi:hypothetical protein
MSILRKLFGQKQKSEPAPVPEHAVIAHFGYGSTDPEPVFALSDLLEQAISAADVGEFDGNGLAADGTDGSLYMYGPDADRLFAVVRPILESAPFMRGAQVKLRYGPAGSGAREQVVSIGA